MNYVHVNYLVGDQEYYTPLAELRGDAALTPGGVPEQWRSARSDIWTLWQSPGTTHIAEDGWKVHVSARADRLQAVLDLVAGICVEEAVPFKHLATRRFYELMHHKFATRSQSGKFIAAYPSDSSAALRLMERLREELADEQGPAVLTDRPFRRSKTVFYRYGAFVSRSRVEADGMRTLLVRDGAGRLVPDLRGNSFRLPDGIIDPFIEPEAAAHRPAPVTGPAAKARSTTDFFKGFAVKSSVRYSNAGGTYRGVETATGRRVFIKEARPDTGIGDGDLLPTEQLRREWQTLMTLHELAPGVAPQPLSYFRVCGHDYLVTEYVEGIELPRWLATTHPLLWPDSTEPDFAAYYERCERIVSAVESVLDRLHDHGYAFVDVSPGNVLIDADDRVRLVDFGAAHRIGDAFIRTGTHGFAAPVRLIGEDVTVCDRYGASALSLFLLAPLNQVAERHPGTLAHLHHDLSVRAPVPPALWKHATRYHEFDDGCEPTPEQVSADPAGRMAVLREQIADALIAMAQVERPGRVFPTIAQGLESNTVCLAYGTAGVVHALRRAGRELPAGLLDRLRRDALDDAADLGPGFSVGNAGTAAVLADCGLFDEARVLLDKADAHPLTGECATLFGGSAGVAMAHLAVYGHTGDDHHVERALALAEALPADDLLTPALGPDDATGLLHGRCGIALMLQQLAGVTGDDALLARATRLLHAELDRATDPDAPCLQFPVSAADNRIMPYLHCGSAGMLFALTRCLRATGDERLAEALPRLIAALRVTYTIMPGLYQGTSGLAFALADHAALHRDEETGRAALATARGLFKFAIPHSSGVRILGDQLLRYSAELWSGSAGVLLALNHVLDPRPDALFTVDALIDGRTQAKRG